MANALIHIPTSAEAYDAAIEGLTRIDEAIIEGGSVDGAPFPRLYESGARYRTEPREVWRHAQDVVSEGWGDCEDLAAYRAAELRVSGEDEGARVKTYKTGPRRYHAIVERGDGTLEDPSAALGMKIPANRRHLYVMDNTDGPEIMLGEDTGGTGTVTFDFYKHGRGWSGVVKFPLSTGQAIIARTSAAPTQAAAAQKAVNLASQTAAALTPAITALMPPQVKAAAAILQNPATAAALKAAGGAVKNVASAGKAAASALKFW